ncbi:hypothetical protein BSM4216_2919 [Bacillus smithii]|jgi:hypothetical protein|nr:hypothetical protein BSM4216_2919 [Bacillus smithii]
MAAEESRRFLKRDFEHLFLAKRCVFILVSNGIEAHSNIKRNRFPF